MLPNSIKIEDNNLTSTVSIARQNNKQTVENVLFVCQHGSHLYGLDTEESDLDLKGVFFNGYLWDLVFDDNTSTIRFSTSDDNRNSKEDVDLDLVEVRKFLTDLANNIPYAMEMVAANEDHILTDNNSELRRRLKDNYRDHFFSSNLDSFFGYVRSMRTKYSVKGERLDAINHVIDVLKNTSISKHSKLRVEDFLDEIDFKHEYLDTVQKELNNNNVDRLLEVAGKQFNFRAPYEKALKSLKKTKDKYGKRAKKDVDWKALSHSFRLLYELIDYLENGFLSFPVSNQEYIKKVKLGDVDFEESQEKLDRLIYRARELEKKTEFPEDTPKINKWKKFVFDRYFKLIKDE